jgi:dihydroorotase
LALREAATSGEPYFFLGTDSAPHAQTRKLAAAGAAGVFTAPAALESYAAIFEAEGKLDNFEAFASLNGPRHYGLPVNSTAITLERSPWTLPEFVPVDDSDQVAVYRGGETIGWRIVR